jgi:hypothetical protein
LLIAVVFPVLLAGLVAFLEALQYLAAPDCEGPGVLLPTAAAGGPVGRHQPHQGVISFLMRLLHKRHISALQVSSADTDRRTVLAAVAHAEMQLRVRYHLYS